MDKLNALVNGDIEHKTCMSWHHVMGKAQKLITSKTISTTYWWVLWDGRRLRLQSLHVRAACTGCVATSCPRYTQTCHPNLPPPYCRPAPTHIVTGSGGVDKNFVIIMLKKHHMCLQLQTLLCIKNTTSERGNNLINENPCQSYQTWIMFKNNFS